MKEKKESKEGGREGKEEGKEEEGKEPISIIENERTGSLFY